MALWLQKHFRESESVWLLCIYQELSAEKSKVASVETKLSSQLSKREQEMIALQTRMQASYQDHVAQTQRLNAKVGCVNFSVQWNNIIYKIYDGVSPVCIIF